MIDAIIMMIQSEEAQCTFPEKYICTYLAQAYALYLLVLKRRNAQGKKTLCSFSLPTTTNARLVVWLLCIHNCCE